MGEPVITMGGALSGALIAPVNLPPGFAAPDFVPAIHARAARALLNAAYAGGEGKVLDLDTWWPALQADAEFDIRLCLCLTDRVSGELVGFSHAWTSGFLKDFAISPRHQGKGLGRILLALSGARLASLGQSRLLLRAVGHNARAVRFYESMGLSILPADSP